MSALVGCGLTDSESSGGTYEVNADGGDVALCIGIIGKSEQQA